MDRYTDLDAVFAHVWEEIAAAADDPGHRFRTPTFGTAQSGSPTLRTVVLREARPEDRVLAFHSDRRAQKVADIQASNRVAWHWWAPSTSEQVRLKGTATVHTDDAVADAMWADQDPESLVVHARSEASGTPVDAPDDGLIDAVQEAPIARDDVAPGRKHFAVVRTVVDCIDWLHLHSEGHYRAQFRCPPETEAVESTWVIP